MRDYRSLMGMMRIAQKRFKDLKNLSLTQALFIDKYHLKNKFNQRKGGGGGMCLFRKAA